MNDNIPKTLIAGALAVIGLYAGFAVWDALAQLAASTPADASGTYAYDGLTFASSSAVWEYQRFVRAGRYYPWLLSINDDIAPLLLGAGMGMAGGALDFLRRLLYRSSRLTHRESWSYPLQGSITGFMVLFTIVAIPGLKNLTGVPSLAGVGFFSGVFSEAAFTWVSSSWSHWFHPSGRSVSPATDSAKPDQ